MAVNSYNYIIALNQCIQKKVAYVAVIKCTVMRFDYTVSNLMSRKY